ncbi:hydrolase [Croceicoccus mobilis]|uniref:Acetylornithine deacetylase n=1 Tax=Croceicoccus mobilis TaxID=1703339 RepID=A0A917DX08_9SPHN|nr:hydrolase [Croceicoccus mobilis]GGD78177.1 acetylornithine deacetylase [Croceicoccus mobilis]
MQQAQTTAITPEQSAMLDAVDAARMLERSCEWSRLNTGTANLEGLARQADMLAECFAMLPGEVRLEDPGPVSAIDASGAEIALQRGQHLVLSVRPDAPRRVLLTGHMDTVFPKDSAFQDISEIEPGVLNGPGLADMKGGIAVIAEALMAFETSSLAPQLGYDVMINADEEVGSQSSAALIERLAKGKHAALTYEPATAPDGTLAGARGGSGNYSVTIKGQSAHAGRNPQDGRNAIVAASDLVLRLKQMQSAEIPINPAKIEGGSANNVVPDHAVLRFNIRPKSREAAAAFEAALPALLQEIETEHGVSAHLHGAISRPPKPIDPAAASLFALVDDSSRALGLVAGRRDTGGVCDGNNIAACGVPVVDTMGVRGGSIHSPEEFLIVESLAERARLSALVLHRIAAGELAAVLGELT